MNQVIGLVGIALCGATSFVGAIWTLLGIRDLIRDANLSDDDIRNGQYTKPGIAEVALNDPSRCRRLFVGFYVGSIIFTVILFVAGILGIVTILKKL